MIDYCKQKNFLQENYGQTGAAFAEPRPYPENLDKLIEISYLKNIPIDPFSDKPLAYKKTENNFYTLQRR
jgi:hypothetical protein